MTFTIATNQLHNPLALVRAEKLIKIILPQTHVLIKIVVVIYKIDWPDVFKPCELHLGYLFSPQCSQVRSQEGIYVGPATSETIFMQHGEIT